MRENFLQKRLCVSEVSTREAGNKSTLRCPEKAVTDNSLRNRQWILQSKSQNRCELSQLSSGEVTRRNPRLCLFFVDKDLHWWLCLNMQENQSYCLKKPFPVAEIQSWTRTALGSAVSWLMKTRTLPGNLKSKRETSSVLECGKTGISHSLPENPSLFSGLPDFSKIPSDSLKPATFLILDLVCRVKHSMYCSSFH